MTKAVAFLGLALVAAAPMIAPVAAHAATDSLVEVDEGLAAASLQAGDFARAVSRLKAIDPDALNDPARLINLGNAYAGLGRREDAKQAYRAARYAPDNMLLLADGTEASSRDIAGKALRRLEATYALR